MTPATIDPNIIIPRERLYEEGVPPWSQKTMRRKEDANLFPKRVRLGPRNYGYRLAEVRAWRDARIVEHEAACAAEQKTKGNAPHAAV
jgi:Prophage CP4-57 regulatory protein (AlpA)